MLGRRGFAGDLLLIAATLLVAAMLFVVLFRALDAVRSGFAQNKAFNGSSQGAVAVKSMGFVLSRLDYFVLALFVGLALGLLVTTYFIPANFIFAAGYFLVMLIAVIISAILSNVWEKVFSAATFATVQASFPITNFLMSNLPAVLAGVAFLGFIVMFAKPSGGSL